MKDKGKETFNVIRRILIIVIIIILIIGIYFIFKENTSKKQARELKRKGYDEVAKNTFVLNKRDGSKTLKYTYGLKTKTFEKYMEAYYDNYQEIMTLTKEDNNIKIYYSYKDINGCSLVQTGTYSKKDFTCNVESKTDSCKLRCDTILNYAKEFEKESLPFK